LPTFQIEDPKLAHIVASWDCLTEEVKARLIEIIEATRAK
jgi:hypothetical protein